MDPLLDAAPATTLRLRVTRTRPGPAVERLELAAPGPVVELGRSPDADLVLHARAASRRHARFVAADGAWWVEDLGSRAGTWLGGRLLPPGRHRVIIGAIFGVPGATVAVEATSDGLDQAGAPPIEALARAFVRLDRSRAADPEAPAPTDPPSVAKRSEGGRGFEIAAAAAAVGFMALAVGALLLDCG